MSGYDDLRRGSYHPDARARAAEQEASELSRGSYRPDALAKAREQEAQERAERSAREAATPRARGTERAKQHDLGDHTIVHRPAAQRRKTSAAGGGAVISRRSGVGAALKRRLRAGQDARERRRDAADERRALRRQSRPSRSGRRPVGLLALIGALVALYLVFCLPIDRAISFSRQEREGLAQELSWHVPATPYYMLAMGSDAREGDEVSRTDTMILMRVDLLSAKITMLSIPRDTKVEIAGYGTQKINAAYAFGGAAGAVRAVHDLTGASISQVALIRFDGVESLVDYLGGVDVNVPVPVYDPTYTGLVLDAGEQHMDGHTALLFSRVRHGFDLGDYQRQKDQRILMEAIMKEALSLPPWKMGGLVGHMGGLVGTTMRMYSIMPLMVRLKLAGEVTIYQATVPSTTAMIDGVSYVIADEAALAQMMEVIDAGGDPAQEL